MDNDTFGDTICCLLILAWFCTIFISVKLFIGIFVGFFVFTIGLLIFLSWPVMFFFIVFLVGSTVIMMWMAMAGV